MQSKKYKLDPHEEESQNNIYVNGRDIYFYSSITVESCFDLIRAIKEATTNIQQFNALYQDFKPDILLHINSFGGEAFSAFAVMDTITSNPVPINTVVEGAAASAATLLSVVGKKRMITKNSLMMVHQLRSGFMGNHESFKEEVENQQKLMGVLESVYKKHCRFGKNELSAILKKDAWLTSDECLKYKLVDEII